MWSYSKAAFGRPFFWISNIMKILLAIGLLFLSTTANAFDFNKFSFCEGVKTVVGRTNVASAFIDPQHGPVIMFHWNAARTLPRDVLEFIYLHECAHHKLGHVQSLYKSPQQEDDADCYARKEFIRKRGASVYNTLLPKFYRWHLHDRWRTVKLNACR